MKELYTAPELKIITFVAMEQLASAYLEDYAEVIGATAPAVDSDGASDIEVSVDGGEGSPT